MPAYFENGVFGGGERAWHGEGIVIPEDVTTIERVMEIVPELGSDVVLQPTYYRNPLTGEFQEIHVGEGEGIQKLCTVRSFDGKVLGDGLTDWYKPRQTAEKFDFLNALIGGSNGERRAMVHTAGTLMGGSRAWLLLRMDGDMQIGGDNVARFLFCSDSYDGTTSTIVAQTRVRIVCANTLAMALADAPRLFKARHVGGLEEKLDQAAEILHMADQYDAAYYELAERLLAKKVTAKQFKAFMDRLIPLPVDASGELRTDRTFTNAAKRRDAVEAILRHDDLANIAGTGWGVYNAVAEYEDWYKPVRSGALSGGEDAQRFQRALMPREAGLKERALEILSA